MLGKDAFVLSLVGFVGLNAGGFSVFLLLAIGPEVLLGVLLLGVVVPLATVFVVLLLPVLVDVLLPDEVDQLVVVQEGMHGLLELALEDFVAELVFLELQQF